jgi:hypothetical protein
MQITLAWTCRECGQDAAMVTDTADYPAKYPLQCQKCGHVSGNYLAGYEYLAEHRPSHEREG